MSITSKITNFNRKLNSTENKNNLKFLLLTFSLIYIFSLIFYVFVFFYGYLIYDWSISNFYRPVPFYLAMLAPIFFFKKPKLYFTILFFVVLIGFIFDYYHFIAYGAMAKDCTVIAILNTNREEVISCLSSYGWGEILFLFSILFAVLWSLIYVYRKFVKRLYTVSLNRYLSVLLLLPLFFNSLFILMNNKPLNEKKIALYAIVNPVASIRLFNACNKYYRDSSKYVNMVLNPKLPNGIKSESRNILGVVIIGESATRYNHSLYGYERDTNPNLSKLKNEMVIFEDFISQIPSTDDAYKKAYIHNDDNNDISFSISDLMLASDFDVYYISPVSLSISPIQYVIFRNSKLLQPNLLDGNADDNILSNIKKNVDIANTEKNVIIFIGLNGSHGPYNKQYSEEFDVFKDDKLVSQFENLDSKERKILNEYDNSIRHTDEVLYNIIDYVSKIERDSFVLYFSDHGDAPFNDKFRYRQGTIGYPYNTEMPMFLWFSDKYKSNHFEKIKNAESNRDKPCMTSTLLYTILDLSDVYYDKFPYEKSLISDRFKPQNIRYLYESGSLLYDKSKRHISDYEN